MKKVCAVILSVALCAPIVQIGYAFGDDESLRSTSEETADCTQFSSSDAEALVSEIASADEGTINEGSLIVTLKDGVDSDAALSDIPSLDSGSRHVLSSDSGDDEVVQLQVAEDASISDAAHDLAGNEDVASVQPDYLYALVESDTADYESTMSSTYTARSYAGTNDPYANNASYSTSESSASANQWYLESIGAKEGWSVSRCEGAVTVAVMDTGINFEHSDLRNVIDRDAARRFYYADSFGGRISSAHYSTSETRSDYAHGTHVAGILAAQAGNGYQFAGVSYNAKVLPIKIFFDSTSGRTTKAVTSDSLLIAAYEYVFDLVDGGRNDIRVINLSLGGDNVDPALKSVIEKARDKYNILTVCAAGNDNTSATVYPADFDACLGVTSVDESGAKASFSNYGTKKDIAAPGTCIWSTYTGSADAKKMLSGTSMSAPMVSGCAALLWAYDPTLSVSDVRDLICSNTKRIPTSSTYLGVGQLDVGAAVKALAESDSIERITQGTDAADTAAAISAKSFSHSNSVILACDYHFADSMSASGLAGALNAPILLAAYEGLSESTVREIRRLGAAKVFVIGGELALPSGNIIPGLRRAGITAEPIRVAGAEAWDTSLACAEELLKYKSSKTGYDKVIMATPDSFQDAVSMSSFAYAYQAPIFLQDGSKGVSERMIPSRSRDFIESHFSNAVIYVPGGPLAVSNASAENAFPGKVQRLTSGSTAYDTSNAIARYMVENKLLSPSTTTFASGASGAKGLDALAGGVFAGKNFGVILLVNGNSDLGEIDLTCVDSFASSYRRSIGSAYVLGGSIVMPSTFVRQVGSLLR